MEAIKVSLPDLDRALDLAREAGPRTWIGLPGEPGLVSSRDLRNVRAMAVKRGKLAAEITIEPHRGGAAIVVSWPASGPSRGARLVLAALDRTPPRHVSARMLRSEPRWQRADDRIVYVCPTSLGVEPGTASAAPTLPQEATGADDRANLDAVTRKRLAVNAALGVGSRFMVAS